MTTEARQVPSWDVYWMNQARSIASRSKDPSTQVGCVLVDENQNPVGQGYNGFPPKCNEAMLTWDRPMKYLVVVHAEMNAIFRSKEIPPNTRAYVTDAPCENCLKHLLSNGVKIITYDSARIMQNSTPEQKRAIEMLIEATNAMVTNFNTGALYEHDIHQKPIQERK